MPVWGRAIACDGAPAWQVEGDARDHFSSLPGLGELLSVVVLAYMGLILGEGSFVCMNGTPEHCIYFTPFSSLARALSTSLMEAAAAAEPLTLSSRSFL